ncbi:hypothetical protein [Pseudothioclava arenosa]|uniref:Uncharacterized protein n=1 Tax=Pseudothioclava arenosa TaxID=1795308 RepID=A0A2A4CPI6_9RHOB|nr:hypothetical protein [Pseudothioclava arenosa]PCD76198.1 hypothetical protein CLN94_10245 [Pseudothioclava arenosa]
MRALIPILALGVVASCGGDTEGDYPALLPQAQILGTPAPETSATGDLSARAAALRARAAGLRGPVIPPGSLPASVE